MQLTECKIQSNFTNAELKGFLFKAWSRSLFSQACYACCQEFLPCSFLPSPSIHLHFFSKTLPKFFPVLAVANASSSLDLQNNIGHPAHRHRWLMQVPIFLQNINRLQSMQCRFPCLVPTEYECMLVNHGPSQQSSKEEYKPWKWGATTGYYTFQTMTMLPTRKSMPRSSRQLDDTKTWQS